MKIYIECVYEKPVKKVLQFFLKGVEYGIVSSVDNADVVVIGIDNKEKLMKDQIVDKKIIYWSGESFSCKNDRDRCENEMEWDGKGVSNSFYIYSFKNNGSYDPERFIWYPYVMDSPYWNTISLKNKDRPYRLCYCSCRARKEREELFKIFYNVAKELGCEDMIHSLGICNAGIPETHRRIPSVLRASWDSFSLVEAYSEYDFVLAVENTMRDGYITEKIMNVYASGAIPVFWGDSKSIESIFQKGSYIDVNDFNSFEECAKYVLSLSQEKIEEIRTMFIYNQVATVGTPSYFLEGSNKLKKFLLETELNSIFLSNLSITDYRDPSVWIDHIIYINLEHRKDRREHITAQIKKLDPEGSKTTRFNAIYYDKCEIENVSGAVGATYSHLGCLKMAYEKGYENTLILEDDFEFIGDISELTKRLIYFQKSPFFKDYKMILLGTNSRYIADIKDPYISIPVQSQTASGYIINRRFLGQLITTFEHSLAKLIETEDRDKYALDMEGWKSFQYPVDKAPKVFTFNNSNYRAGRQIASYSDIERASVYYGGV